MQPMFPAERAAQRSALLAAAESIRPVLLAHADESEALRTLAPAEVEALTASGLLSMKCPRALGGAETDPVTQIEVIEAVSHADAAAGWCVSIGNGALYLASALLPDAGLADVFGGPRVPRFSAALQPGRAVAVEGGYRIDGRWAWGSASGHAEWVAGLAIEDRGEGQPPRALLPLFRPDQLTFHDTWHVVGLKGTGSADYSAADCFVPAARVLELAPWSPLRGGPLFQLGLPGGLVNELAGFALGVGRRALDTVIEIAQGKRRGYGRKQPLAERQVFQRAIAEADLRLRAARSLVCDVFERAWQTVCAGASPSTAQQVEMIAAVTYTYDAALAATTTAFRYGGGNAVRLSDTLQRCLRDMYMGAAHLMVSDVHYELYGQCLLGMPAIDPMS